MKKVIIVVVGLLFACFVLVLSLFTESKSLKIDVSEGFPVDVEYSTNSAKLNEYLLPYPGLLPDNPLYGFKMVRDRLRLVLSANKRDKFRNLVLLGDKRVGAAYFLAIGKKIPLSYETFLRSNNYISQAVELLEKIDDRDNSEEWKLLERSINTHIETIQLVMEMVEGETRVKFERVLEQYKSLQMRIEGKTGFKINEEGHFEDEGYL